MAKGALVGELGQGRREARKGGKARWKDARTGDSPGTLFLHEFEIRAFNESGMLAIDQSHTYIKISKTFKSP